MVEIFSKSSKFKRKSATYKANKPVIRSYPYRRLCCLLALFISIITGYSQDIHVLKITPAETFVTAEVAEKGLLGREMMSSMKGRLTSLPDWRNGELITMFSQEARNRNKTTDWYGEHAGKWMYTAALAVKRTSDKHLKALLLRTADYLVGTQGQDGYLGSYSNALRITNPNSKLHARSWDVWSLTYMTLGLLEVNKVSKNPKYLDGAKKIGELFLSTFGAGKANVTDYGTRNGISATILLEAVVELYKTTGEQKYLDFAQLVVKEMEQRKGVRFIASGLNKVDLENVGDGKAYQIVWNLMALTKYYTVTGNQDCLTAVENNWQNVVDYHLSLTGGPWGGIGKHYECFNAKNFWSPYGFIETCSVMSWIQLNKELLSITGDAKYAQQIENASYNALLGAKYANGEDWSYHSFTNGRRHVAHFNDCCPSSGALALEEVASVVYSLREGGIACNLYANSTATLKLVSELPVTIKQETNYPYSGEIKMTLNPARKSKFPVFIRIPDWCGNASIKVNGKQWAKKNIQKGRFLKIEADWSPGDQIDINFPIELTVLEKSERAKVPQGSNDIYKINWFALQAGPLIYATGGLFDGKDREKSFQFPVDKPGDYIKKIPAQPGKQGDSYQLTVPGSKPLVFVPFFEAGGRKLGTWHFTWIQHQIE
ncbi:MAG TPA: beta-L-arabinofuranosidase domain-containing protein [Arachidicoccus sp.]|nr:beta-L-arabinofuranosidase domain-containing protein [Arachidicoccus sp.]